MGTPNSIGLEVYIIVQVILILIYRKCSDSACFPIYMLLVVGFFLMDIGIMIILTLDQPGWLIGLTAFKLIVELAWLFSIKCCEGRGALVTPDQPSQSIFLS